LHRKTGVKPLNLGERPWGIYPPGKFKVTRKGGFHQKRKEVYELSEINSSLETGGKRRRIDCSNLAKKELEHSAASEEDGKTSQSTRTTVGGCLGKKRGIAEKCASR